MRRCLCTGLVLAGTLGLTSCITHRGAGWGTEADDRPAAPEGITLVLLGDAGAATDAAETTAAQVQRVLGKERANERTTVVLWLGNNTHSGKRRSPCPDAPATGPQSADLAAAIRTYRSSGGHSYAVAGPVEWKCGLVDARRRDVDETLPYARPAPQYVVSVGPGGNAKIRWSCTETGCNEGPAADSAVLELVMVDATPWIDRATNGESALRALDRLLEVLDASQSPRPPRVLVSHFPVEAAGEHGVAGYDADATIHTLYPPLRDAVLGGAFDGVVAAHDHATYAHPDLTDAIKRSDRMWTKAPLWQVVSGAASMPDARSGRPAPRMRYFTNTAYSPEAYTPHAGFAVVRIDGNEVQATLHAKRRKWETATVSMPLRAAKNPVQSESPSLAPCLGCKKIPPSER